MFLQVMNQEEKEKFLELIYKVANIDSEYAEEEQEIIENYKIELELEVIKDTAGIEELIHYFASKATTLKKIVLFETIGMVNADDRIEEEEEKVLSLMEKEFEFATGEAEQIKKIAEKLQKIYDEIYDVIFD